MRKKQNRKLIDKKNSQDEERLVFSITKSAKHNVYDPLESSLPDSYKNKKERMQQEEEEIKKISDFWSNFNKADEKINEIGEEIISEARGVLEVHMCEHKASPFVVHIGSSENSESPKSLSATFNSSKTKNTKTKQREEKPEWLKEVERIRKNAADSYISGTNKVRINFLSASEGQNKARPKRAKLKKIGSPKGALEYPKIIFAGFLRWLFEFALSIPLGFLLFFEVVLKAVNFVNKGAIKSARFVGKSVSFIVEQTLFIIIAAFKVMVAAPFKIGVVLFIGIYKSINLIGFGILLFIKAIAELLTNYLRVIRCSPKNFWRKIAATAVLCAFALFSVKFLYIIPQSAKILEGKVLGATKDGFANMAEAGLFGSEADFAIASQKFSKARDAINSLNIIVRGVISILPQGQDGIHAIAAGEDLAESARIIAMALGQNSELNQEIGPVELIKNFKSAMESAIPKIQSALGHLYSINPKNIPEEEREKFLSAREILPKANLAIVDFMDFADILLETIGSSATKRYVVLFQNNNELRPAGGFIGSFALIDVDNGVIKNIKIPGGGPYDFQGYLTENVASPKPLQLINPRWEMQDANWYADWPTSAEKVSWFLEKSGESSVDGVIGIQATTLAKLLAVLGPVYFDEYQIELNSENIIEEIQKQVELNYDKQENQPKKYVAQLAPLLIERILSLKGDDLLKVLSLVKSEISRKDILIYFKDNKTNSWFEKMGLLASVSDSSMDYLSVVHANIGGGKTDGVIEETWNHRIIIDTDGTAFAELEIVRKHNGDLSDIFEGVNNVDYVRIYTPLGSELISFEGVKPPDISIYEKTKDFFSQDEELLEIEANPVIDEKTGTRITSEFGKTVFGNWLQVDPGNTLFAKISYKLPFKIKPFDIFNSGSSGGYSILIQKQPGARDIHYSVSIEYPPEWDIAWKKSSNEKAGNLVQILGPGLSLFEGNLSHDTGFAALFESK